MILELFKPMRCHWAEIICTFSAIKPSKLLFELHLTDAI
jgi:hypothetical protein